jgi:AcrR family transcriptional regulator
MARATPKAKTADVTEGGAHASEPPEADAHDRVLRGAVAAFSKHGYGTSTVEHVLEEAGVSRRTFYKHFRNKQEVLKTLFERSARRLLTAVRDAGATPGTHAERVVAAVDAYVQLHAKAGPLGRLLLVEQLAPSSDILIERDKAFAEFAELIAASAERQGRGAPDPLVVHAVVAGINAICVRMSEEYPPGGWDIARAKRSILRVLRALAVEPRR